MVNSINYFDIVLYKTSHFICVEYIGMKSLQVSGGESLVSLINNLLKTSYCTLFFVWVFSLWVSHIKFLMRQYRHKTISYHPFFPKRFLVDDIGTYDTLYSFLYVSFSFFEVSHIKFLMRQCQHKLYAMSSSFPHRGF